MENEPRTVAASRGEALRSRVRGLVRVDRRATRLADGAVHGVRSRRRGCVHGLLPDFRATLLGALAGVVVAASGSGGPSGISRRVALVAAGVGFVLMAVAFATGNDPVWAALAMAAVALLTSLAAAAGPLGALLGFLVSLAYFLIATMARVADLFDRVSVPGRLRTSRWAASAACSSSSSARPSADGMSRRSSKRLARRFRSSRCGSRCGASTSMRATEFAAQYRSQSSCSSFSRKAVATRSGSSSPPTSSS